MTWGPSAGATPRQAAGGVLTASPATGLPGEPLTISGTGCAGGIVDLRLDGQPWSPFPAGDANGDWSATLSFPAAVGPHEIEADCSDFTTVGAPTTFYAPGEVRFAYDPVTVRTDAPELVDPTVTAPPSPSPVPPPAAAPAAPTQSAPRYTG
jgi:hypothetical protein